MGGAWVTVKEAWVKAKVMRRKKAVHGVLTQDGVITPAPIKF